MSSRSCLAGVLAFAWFLGGCASRAERIVDRSRWIGTLTTPLGPVQFGLELAEAHGGPVQLWSAGNASRCGTFEREPGRQGVALDAGGRLELGALGPSGPVAGEWRRDGAAPIPFVLERAPLSAIRFASPPVTNSTALSGTWFFTLEGHATGARLELALGSPAPLAELSGELGRSALTVSVGRESHHEPGLCATLSCETLALGGFDGRNAWLLRGELEGDTLAGELWSSELGTLAWSARREAAASTGR